MRLLLTIAMVAFGIAVAPAGAASAQTITQTAAADYERKCSVGDPESCWVVGRWYKGGIKMPLDTAKAAKLLKRSCDLGYKPGCDELADMERSDKLANPASAVVVYDSECSAGNGESCLKAAQIYHEGAPGVAKDQSKVALFAERACKAGKGRGCMPAAQLAAAAGKFEPALKLAEAGCALKDAQSCGFAAKVAVTGLASPDPARALKAVETGCALKDGDNCLLLAMLHSDGRFLPKDEAKARQAAQSACNLRSVDGCNLAYQFASSIDETMGALRALCILKVADACVERGRRFEEGDGVPQSNLVALTAYRSALAIDPNHSEAKRRSEIVGKLPAK